MRPSVYLAGQISGLDYRGAKGWRDYAIRELNVHGIAGVCPMRAQEHLATVGTIEADAEAHAGHVTTTSRAIMVRDHWDVHQCDLLIANVLGMAHASIGTTMEIAWAYHAHKPVILIEEAGGIHVKHPMIIEAILYRVDSLDAALGLAAATLGAYR